MAQPSEDLPLYAPLTDLVEVAEVMQRSWKENNEQSLRYTPEFLRSCIEYPGTIPGISLGLFLGGKLAAFVVGMPGKPGSRTKMSTYS